eukprot:363547-Chlamydomonas_euryale.AAC.5
MSSHTNTTAAQTRPSCPHKRPGPHLCQQSVQLLPVLHVAQHNGDAHAMCRRQRPPDRAAHRLDQPCQVHAVTSTRHRDTRNGARSIRRAGRRQAGGEGGVHRRCERRAGVRCGRRRRRRRRRDVQDLCAA